MNKFEEAMLLFSQSIFVTYDTMYLNDYQRRVLSVWSCLISILSEYSTENEKLIVTDDAELQFLKTKFLPPAGWTVSYASLDALEWMEKVKRHVIGIYHNTFHSGHPSPIAHTERSNTQISSFGMGNLFIQVFSSKLEYLITDYRIAASASGLSQLWPKHNRFWPFAKGLAKFPANLRLTDEEADVMADAFYERLRIMAKTPQPNR
jgi:hypothetical protein